MTFKKELDRRHRFSLNVVSNYAAKLWGVASIYVFVPLYVNHLGIDAYGLIAFNAIVLAILYIADAGLSQSFSREAAKSEAGQGLLDLFTSIERVLLFILLLVCSIFLIMCPFIAENWLDKTGILSEYEVQHSLWLMGISVVPQVMMSLYFGGLMGLQYQVSANVIWIAFGIIRSGIVLVPIYFLPDVRVFFAWQIASATIMTLIMRHTLRSHLLKAIGPPANRIAVGFFSWSALNSIRAYAAGMFGMSIIAALNMQIDKVVVSFTLPLDVFAEYALVSALAQLPIILTLPIASALLPRLTSIIHDKSRHGELTALYSNTTYYIASIATTAGVALCLFLPDVVTLWMHGKSFDGDALQAGRLLTVGSLLMALQLAPFQLSLANGHVATNVRLGATILVISVPSQVILTGAYGLVGAAVPWLVLNFFASIFLGIALNKRFPVVQLRQWLFKDIVPSFVCAPFFLVLARCASYALDADALLSCGIAAFGTLVAIGSLYHWRHRGGDKVALEQRAS